jgi:hypothetical protein
MRVSDQVFLVILVGLGWVAAPASLIWGWVRWIMAPKHRSITSVLSLIGFLLASASALLAISSIIYVQEMHDFRYYGPLLVKIFRVGDWLSVGAIVFGIGGVWRSNSLRWQSPVAAVGMLAFWLGMALAV